MPTSVESGAAWGIDGRVAAWTPKAVCALKTVVKGLAGAAAVALCYQLVHWSGVVDARVLPSVTTILAQMARLAVNPDFHSAIVETVWPALVGSLELAPSAFPPAC